MNTFSYHIFYFPFKWDIKGVEFNTLSERIDLTKLHFRPGSCWERTQNANSKEAKDLYNEKNYYYKFVHKTLYDSASNEDNIIMHFERKECKEEDKTVQYVIKKRGRTNPFTLDIDAININLYSTGIGFLSFYLSNRDESQKDPDSILGINQYGRRVMPPFFDDIKNRMETSEYIRIDGLDPQRTYFENFEGYTVDDDWKQGSFITNLIDDLSDNILIEPVIDDRMFVACWYKNDEMADEFKKNADAFYNPENDFSSFWYKFLFVDGGFESCQNDEMKRELLNKYTYKRWQKIGTLYGCSRYSMVLLANSYAPDFLFNNFNTMYARMIELVLVQRASTLRFSEEVTEVSNLSNQEVGNVSTRVSSLYKEYIRFVNQIYFKSVTAQDQGVELYNLLQDNLSLSTHIKDLDDEIGELFNYVFLKEERARNNKATFLNDVAVLFLPTTFVAGVFGMNVWKDVIKPDKDANSFLYECIVLAIGLIIAICIIFRRKKRL